MKRKPIPNKVRALLQKEIDSICPFCGIDDVDHFEVHHIDENCENNEFANLILICPLCHSKITKGDISQKIVKARKNALRSKVQGIKKMPARILNFHSKVENAVIGDSNKITINVNKTSRKNKYPEGCVGFDIVKANYISYLITRYHEYKLFEVQTSYFLKFSTKKYCLNILKK